MHFLEAGFETTGRPCLLLLHGFPDLAYCWRRVMPGLASAGYHVVAPDLRGYGRTTGWHADYDDDLGPFRMLNHVRDMIGLVAALGYSSVEAVAGHDFGSPVAAWSALIRPDIFRAVVMMSAPFAGVAPLPLGPQPAPRGPWADDPIHQELANLPRPRKHYRLYYSTREANAEMQFAPQGLHDFIRGYFPLQERGRAAEPAVRAGRLDGGGHRPDARVLRDGPGPDPWPRRSRRTCRPRRPSRPIPGPRTPNSRST